jgi:hypothetical protein
MPKEGLQVSQGGVSLNTNAGNDRTLGKRVRASYIVITVPVFNIFLLVLGE